MKKKIYIYIYIWKLYIAIYSEIKISVKIINKINNKNLIILFNFLVMIKNYEWLVKKLWVVSEEIMSG